MIKKWKSVWWDKYLLPSNHKTYNWKGGRKERQKEWLAHRGGDPEKLRRKREKEKEQESVFLFALNFLS